MSDFSVVLGDLGSMAKTFDDESNTYQGLVPKFLPTTAVDSGDGTLNETMKSALEWLELLHHQMVRTIQTHAQKLAYARDTYAHHDATDRQLFDKLTTDLN